MHYPSFGELADALQFRLDVVLSDPVLGRGTLGSRGPGRPIVHGGTFALTYEVMTDAGKYALRCFHKELDALQVRYDAIGRHLRRVQSPCFVNFQFQPQGITTESGTYPVVRMDWAEGQNLAAFVASHRNDARVLLQLRTSLHRLAKHLRENGIAHGDLQPSNIIVESVASLRLIDYDGLFVPELASFCSPELGQRNFQHPGRRARHFDASLDAFSFSVIDLALHALCIRPDLWDLTGSGEDAFLLRAVDYADPAKSATFGLLAREPEIKQATRNLAAICIAPFEQIPSFADFLAGHGIPAVSVEWSGGATTRTRPAYLSPHGVLDAENFVECCKHVGDRVELVGRVSRVGNSDATGAYTEYLRVEFGAPLCDMTCLRIWPDELERFDVVPDSTWVGQWVSAVGLLEPVSGGRGGEQRPKDVSISVTDSGQLQRLSEAEAHYRLYSQDRLPDPSLNRAGGVRTDPVHPVPPRPEGSSANLPVEASTRSVAFARAPVGSPIVSPQDRPSGNLRLLNWGSAAILAALAAALLLSRETAREQPAPAGEVADGAPSAVVARIPEHAEAEKVAAELLSQQSLNAADTTIETAAGALSIVSAADGNRQHVVRVGGEVVDGLRDDVIVLAHRAAYSDRDVVVGFARCGDDAAACGRRKPFWLVLRPGSPPVLRQVPEPWTGAGAPTVSASSAGVQVDLGTWNGERRLATLTAAGDLEVERTREPIRALSRPDCALVVQSLEDCAVSRDCRSFALSAQRIQASRWIRLKRAYHESTGLDVAVFRVLCVRSCELGFTPSYELIRRNACDGAKPDQWPPGEPTGGLER